MSNITSWADASSSDEESDDERIAPPPSNLPGSTSYNNLQGVEEDLQEEDDEALQLEKDYAFLFETQPPYTAFVGNLSFDMKNSNDFGVEVQKMLGARKCVASTEKGGK